MGVSAGSIKRVVPSPVWRTTVSTSPSWVGTAALQVELGTRQQELAPIVVTWTASPQTHNLVDAIRSCEVSLASPCCAWPVDSVPNLEKHNMHVMIGPSCEGSSLCCVSCHPIVGRVVVYGTAIQLKLRGR